jgi:serine/threonine protein kinase
MEELADLLDSVPMPARLRQSLASDNESTEQIAAAASREQGSTLRRRNTEPTQPIKVLGFSSDRPPHPARHDLTAQVREELGEAPGAGTGNRSITDASAIRPGDVLAGRYVVIEQVDHRGMGLVYRALDRHREKAGSPVPWVALKFASATGVDTVETSACLRQEFLKLSQLNHPNVVSVFDLGCHDALDFIVMEWLDGETLASALTQLTSKRIALDKAADIIRHVARALAHAHDLGIVHGDVKPSNIFLTGSRAIKVLDFGSSAKSTADRGESERNWATRAYASCELLQGQMPQPSDDVFALGVTAYCLLSGERPFGDLDALAAREQGIAPPPLPEGAREYWPAVAHALRFDAIDRPGSATVFVQELDEPAVDPAPLDPPSPAVAYGALAATLLASLVWWSVQSTGALPPDVKSALDNGNDALAEGRLLAPKEDSALDYYATVLAAAPDNPEALDGIDRIAEQYLSRARQALEENDLQAASADLRTARRVSPGHFGIAVFEDLIGIHARELLASAREAAVTEPGRAGQLLQQAESLLPANDPGLRSAREFLAQQKVEQEVDALLQGIDERILAERLTVPEGDSAVDLLRRARALAPDNREVVLTADRIMTALLFQAMFAISNSDLDDAARFIDAAKAMGTKHLALARAEYELAKARRQALAARASR